ncbi:MAG: peptide deformylase [Reichenbachiella sp.]|uniref:peptide deformylase n=1 Tax=Reichenbachiella sp. TaxID=2184521 RepID=UPI003264CD50
MIYPIVVYGDPVLKREADEIEEGSIDVIQLRDDMFETMYEASGIGLAAPQIGKSIRMFVVDGSPLEEEGMEDFKKVFINPEIVWEEGEKWNFEEGCLSIPGIREEISRHRRIRVNYLDENFKEHEEEFDGMKARIFQHEYDHIDGILFTDYLSPFKKRVLKGKLNNITKGKCDADYKIKIPSRK